MTQWIRQEHVCGCVVASLAMILGRSYQSVHDELAPEVCYDDMKLYESPEIQALPSEQRFDASWRKGNDFSRSGICLDDACRWLERKGFATQLRYKFRWGHEPVAEWPPKPWAPIHLCGVVTSQAHAIVMLADGTLLDSNRPPGTWCGNWSEYKSVDQVIGLWKVA